MDNLSGMLWIEWRKAVRSKMPLWTALGSTMIPFGMAFLIFVSKNPAISRQLGLVSAKADLMAYAATDWATYLGLYGLIIAAVGFLLFVLITSWVFGREFSDGTLKDLLAVPVRRASILLAKFILVALWSIAVTVLIFTIGLALGALIALPGGSPGVLLHGSGLAMLTAAMAIMVASPFAFLASVGRGYLLPIGAAVLVMMMTNLVVIIGWGAYFPWARPVIYAQGKSPLEPASYAIVVLTGLCGLAITYLWWKVADQSR
jgi:ABC-2 type transport system permease protein